MGHVPQDPIHPLSQGAQFQGRERRRTAIRRHSRSDDLAQRRLARARWAEYRVARWYEQQGFEILAMNWTIRGGELDVVARRKNLVVVCEVKARADDSFGTPLDAMTPIKCQRVRRTGYEFLRSLDEPGVYVRFDVASVLGSTMEIFEDAF